MTKHDVWYLTCETMINGERRGFSRQIKAHPARRGETVPAIVQSTAQEFLAGVVNQCDLTDYHDVLAGKRQDFPYRWASYALYRNSAEVVRSWAVRPIKPAVLT